MICPVCKKEVKSLEEHFKECSEDQQHIDYYMNMYYRIIIKILNGKTSLKDIPEEIESEHKELCLNSWVFDVKNKEFPLMDYGIKKIDLKKIPENFVEILKKEMNHMDIYRVFHYVQPDSFSNPYSLKAKRKKLIHIDGDHSNFLITNLEVYQNDHYTDIVRNQPYIRIEKDFKFDSAHNLLNGYEGKCKNVHGHTYKLKIAIKNKINPKTDMVMDFGSFKDIVETAVISKLDHRDLNEVMDFNPTAERILFWIWKVLEQDALLKGMVEIKLWETEDSSVILNYKDVLNCNNYLKTYFFKIGVF